MAQSKNENTNESLSLLERLRKKDRLVVVDLDTYEEIRHFNFSALSLIIYALFFAFIIIVFTWLIIAFTPVKQAIPGYPNINKQKALAYKNKNNEEWLAANKEKLNQEHIYYKNLKTILSDSVVATTNHQIEDTVNSINHSQNFNITENDSLLRQKIDEKEKYLIQSNNNKQTNNDLKGILFFPPLNGSISDSINIKGGHYGVDIIAPKDEPVKATLNGTVIFTDWTPDNGNVIHIQHANNLVSVYKHNSVLLKKIGDYVKTGEPIAIIGNSGKLSTGPHLHFELWHKGIVLNPVNYIIF